MGGAARAPAAVLAKLRGPNLQLSVLDASPPPRPQAVEPVVRTAVLAKLRGPNLQLSVLDAIPPPGPQAVEHVDKPVAGRLVYVLHNSLPWSRAAMPRVRTAWQRG